MSKSDKKARLRVRVRPSKQGTGGRKTLTVSKGGKEKVTIKDAKIKKFTTDPVYVRIGAGVTKNMGDYESLRVDVSISMPCYREDMDKTFDKVAEDVAKRLSDEVDKYMAGV